MSNPIDPPLLTADLPGIGGTIRRQPEDFEVEEIPAYEPTGQGDHLFLWVEKRGVGAEFFVRQISKRLGVPPADVGTAGLKDRHAVTRQWVSVPAAAEPRLPQLDGDGIRVLQVSRHTNKLRPGHLRGNRFRILIRGADSEQTATVESILERIRSHGLPNFYGEQRFGRDGETSTLGLAMLRGESTDRRPGFFLRKLALSAAQSWLFNDYLGRRLNEGLLRRVLAGDVMAKWPAGGMFVAEDVSREQERFDAREIVTAGPMFGRKTFAAAGQAIEREAAVLRDAGLTAANFDGFGKLVQGTRRHNLVYIDDLAAAWEADGVRLTFKLPAGSYATVLLREVMKAKVEGEEET
ncbi:MAG: tRNA pseudouridine(13) synthase TruD [Gemmataceae bacterium]